MSSDRALENKVADLCITHLRQHLQLVTWRKNGKDRRSVKS
jgi:hypothetical protein